MVDPTSLVIGDVIVYTGSYNNNHNVWIYLNKDKANYNFIRIDVISPDISLVQWNIETHTDKDMWDGLHRVGNVVAPFTAKFVLELKAKKVLSS